MEWVDPFRFEFPEQLTLTTYRISIEHIWTYYFLGANDDKWCVFPFYIFNTHSLGGDEPSRESGGWSGACERAGTELEPEQLMRQTMPFASVCYRLWTRARANLCSVGWCSCVTDEWSLFNSLRLPSALNATGSQPAGEMCGPWTPGTSCSLKGLEFLIFWCDDVKNVKQW